MRMRQMRMLIKMQQMRMLIKMRQMRMLIKMQQMRMRAWILLTQQKKSGDDIVFSKLI